MRFAVVAHRSTRTNAALVAAAAGLGLDARLLAPRDALRLLEPGDVALGRLDVREGLDGIESGTLELDRLVASGVEVLNRSGTLAAAHDKLLTSRVLRLVGLPHPHTWLVAERMPAPAPELPLVLKPRFGSWGRDVALCATHAQLEAALERLAYKGWYREHGALGQELVPPLGSRLEAPAAKPPPPGRRTDEATFGGSVWDLRVVVAGDRVVGAARRVAAPGEWRTNAALGARVEPTDPPALARTLALEAVRALHADLAGVDLLPTRTGFVVLEVNGAVEFRPEYSLAGDVHSETVLALLRSVAERQALAAVGA